MFLPQEHRREPLDQARTGKDHRRIKSAVEALNKASESFAARRMDRAVAGALGGMRVEEVAAGAARRGPATR